MNQVIHRVCLAIASIALTGAIVRFAYLRFQGGDVYPPYSTLRSDPLGAKVLFESFNRLESTRTRRNVQPIEGLKSAPNSTIVLLGARSVMAADEEERLTNLAHEGARIVVALDARDSHGVHGSTVRASPGSGKGGTNASGMVPFTFTNMFGLNLGVVASKKDTNFDDAKLVLDDSALPEEIPWFGRYSFSGATNDWQTVYSLRGQPVVVQKKTGSGSIVLIADSFPFSNEGLRITPTPTFLLWIKANGTIFFDETHLGIERGAGVTVLMREFRLHGFVIGCILLAIFWIWRNSAPLVPPLRAEDGTSEQSMEGKTAREAIVHLLRKNLNAHEALRVGLEAWTKEHPPRFYWETVRLEDAKKLVAHAAGAHRPNASAAVQRQLSELLYPKRG